MSLTKEQLGPYRLVRVLGRGGMSVVYEGFDTRFERRVAVKVINVPSHLAYEDQMQSVARLQREARVIARLSHPNIVSIYDIGEEAGLHYLVMEYVEGITLRQQLDDMGPLSYAEAGKILDQIVSALDTVHSAGIIHRDLKPLNVMLVADTNLKVKLLDFGVARPKDDSNITQSNFMVGTPEYLAPEQVTGGELTASSDLWALGVLLYEMLSCKTPFHGSSMHETMMNIVHAPPAPMPGVLEPIQDVIHYALGKQPRDRFASGQAFARTYHRALKMTGVVEGAPNAEPSTAAVVAEPVTRPEPTPPPVVEAPVAQRRNVVEPVVALPERPVAPVTPSNPIPIPTTVRQGPNRVTVAACIVLALVGVVLAVIFCAPTRNYTESADHNSLGATPGTKGTQTARSTVRSGSTESAAPKINTRQ